jgi:hypothetical protein
MWLQLRASAASIVWLLNCSSLPLLLPLFLLLLLL